MKKCVFLLSVIAASLLLASCASKEAPITQPSPAPAPVAAHHDFKGEVGK